MCFLVFIVFLCYNKIMNILEVGQILRPHGVKGAVKAACFLEGGIKDFTHLYIGKNLIEARVKNYTSLNNDACAIMFDIIPDIDTAEKFRNEYIYIDRDEYAEIGSKVYLTDLIGKDVIDENEDVIGQVVDVNDYGATPILTIREGAASFDFPFAKDLIEFRKDKDALITNRKKFEDNRI